MANSNSVSKVTSRMFIEFALANCTMDEEYKAKGQAMLDALDKKSSGSGKPTKTQIENEGIKQTILDTLATIGSGTVTAIQKANAELSELSNQKITSLLTQLVKDNKVDKNTEKKISTFSLVVED